MANTQTVDDRIAALLEPMLKKRLFVALSTARASAAEMFPHVPSHLEYMNGLEAKGLLFASGPLLEPGVLVGDGLTILQTDTLEEARNLMDAEPLIRLGMRTCVLRTWELREGRMSFTLSASTGKFTV